MAMMPVQIWIGILGRLISNICVCLVSKAMHMAAFGMSSAYLVKGMGIRHQPY